VVLAADRTDTVAEFLDEHPDPQFSRIPVYEGTVDHATGIVFKDDLLAAQGTGDSARTIAELEREALFVPASLSLAMVLPQLLERRQQLAIVVDEYGVTAGVVTVEDLLETLLGLEIMDEKDSVADLQRLARERWETRRREL
jgi:CBS domain containing-hemolysin-like protein